MLGTNRIEEKTSLDELQRSEANSCEIEGRKIGYVKLKIKPGIQNLIEENIHF